MEGSARRTFANIPLVKASHVAKLSFGTGQCIPPTVGGPAMVLVAHRLVKSYYTYYLCYSANFFVHLTPYGHSSRSAGADLTGSSEDLHKIPSYKHTEIYQPFH